MFRLISILISNYLNICDYFSLFLVNNFRKVMNNNSTNIPSRQPGGGLMFTTINRTIASWLFAIMLAENVAGLVPPGTHEYHKLVPPHTLTGAIADCKSSD